MEKNDLKHMMVLLEEVSLADFQDADFIDVFMSVFKEWLVTNKGVIVQKFPISYLLKKYGQDFADDFKIDESLRDDWEDNVNYWTLIQIGRVLVSKGIAMIPSLNQNEKLTEKFKKQIDFFVSQMNLPPFVKIQFHEEKPQDVTISVVVDFPEYVKSNNTISKNYYKEILSFFSNYLSEASVWSRLKLNWGGGWGCMGPKSWSMGRKRAIHRNDVLRDSRTICISLF